MKKFLSICLVALCSVSAMYAQGTITDSRTGVTCETSVSVQAISTNGFYHLKEWTIENGADDNATVLSTIAVAEDGNTSGTTYGANVSSPTYDISTGVETTTLTLTAPIYNLIDAVTSGTVTFKAIFAIDEYIITGESNDAGMGTVASSGTPEGSNTVRLTATVNNENATCAKFDHWEALDGDIIADPKNPILDVVPLPTWTHKSSHRFKAVFVTKTIDINVKSNNTSMGTVTITAPAANQQ